MPLVVAANAAGFVGEGFDGPEDFVQAEEGPELVDAGHVGAEGLGEEQEHGEIEGELEEACRSHENFSG